MAIASALGVGNDFLALFEVQGTGTMGLLTGVMPMESTAAHTATGTEEGKQRVRPSAIQIMIG
jgi:hypothetical protein